MGKVKLNQPIQHEGKITTIVELAGKGLIDFKEAKNFQFRGKRSTRYFADLKSKPMEGWEIGKLAYLSRTKNVIKL